MICNLSEAALHLGFRSRSTLQRLVAKGYLDGYLLPSEGCEVLLETDPPGLPSLRETVQAATQYRPGSPLWHQPRRRPVAAPLAELSDEELGARCDEVMSGLDAVELGPDWVELAEQLNAYLGDSWPPPPWDSGQAAQRWRCVWPWRRRPSLVAEPGSIGRWLEAAGRVPLLTATEELHLGAMVQAWQQWPGGADQAPAGVRRLRAPEATSATN